LASRASYLMRVETLDARVKVLEEALRETEQKMRSVRYWIQDHRLSSHNLDKAILSARFALAQDAEG
jgi:hypothetical protein